MCPDCGEVLVAFELHGIEIDSCPWCGGTWLDAGELDALTTAAGLVSGALSAALAQARRGAVTRRRCPRCLARLDRVTVNTVLPLALDRCRRGHGLWFDRGEIPSLMRTFVQGQEGAVARFLADLHRHAMDEGTP